MGMVGHARRIAPTVIADAMNTAARIQEWTRVLGARLLLSRAVFDEVAGEGLAAARSLGCMSMRGRSQAVELEVYAAESEPVQEGRRAAEGFAAAVAGLASGARGAASAHLADVLAVDPGDSVAQYLFASCADAW